jgi:hypothetical protein
MGFLGVFQGEGKLAGFPFNQNRGGWARAKSAAIGILLLE